MKMIKIRSYKHEKTFSLFQLQNFSEIMTIYTNPLNRIINQKKIQKKLNKTNNYHKFLNHVDMIFDNQKNGLKKYFKRQIKMKIQL